MGVTYVWWNVGMDEKGYVGAYMFMVSVVYVSGRVLSDGVVSVSIHLGGEDGLGVERLRGAYVVWSMLQIYYLARGRQFV